MSQLPPLNALRAFEASARLGSFTKAADELNVTQAAVSQQVKILEHHLKATLFIREAKGIRLTDAGQSYQPVLSQVFHSLRIGTEDLFGERGNNTLSLRVSNTFAEHFLAPRLPNFLKDYPRFRVRLYTSPWSQSDQRSQPDIEIYNGYGDWAYMDKLHANIKNYTHSGSRPCVYAATGETAIGISFAFRGAREKQRGAPLELIFPTEGVGWDMEATAIIAGTKQQQAAQTLVDWSISQAAMEMYNEGYAIVAMPGVAKPVQYFPTNAESLLIDNNFQFAAANRERILREWERRYDAKSEAK